MKMMSRYIAFFDLDHTITGAVSGTEIAREARRRGLMARKDFFRALWLSVLYRLSLRDPRKIVAEMAGWVRGLELSALESITSRVIDELLIPSVYSDALSEIAKHRLNGASVVLLSSTTGSVAAVMSAHLGLDDFICSELEHKDGILTGRTVRPLCFGEEKAVRLLEYCEKNNTKPQDCWYYGDSLADKHAMEACGMPVCVNPARKLRKLARTRKWEIVMWK